MTRFTTMVCIIGACALVGCGDDTDSDNEAQTDSNTTSSNTTSSNTTTDGTVSNTTISSNTSTGTTASNGQTSNTSTTMGTSTMPDPFADLDPFADDDGDGILNGREIEGYEILIDFSGFGLNFPGFLTRRQVTSDPTIADTDGDGLDDLGELRLRSDPRVADTDGDTLSDGEEATRWLTSPVSVDTDGDSRGGDPDRPLPPLAEMFDAAELDLQIDPNDPEGPWVPGLEATSPVSPDTDGDGLGDLEERRNLVRNPVVADVPSFSFDVVDAVDIRLQYEYDDEGQQTETFESSLATTNSTTRSWTDSLSNSLTQEFSGSLGAELQVGFGEESVSVGLNLSASVGSSTTIGSTITHETERESARSATITSSQARSASESRSVATSGGEMSMGVRFDNDGIVAYEVRNMAFIVRQYLPEEGRFRSVALMQPRAGFDSYTLRPGSGTDVVFFEDRTLSADTALSLLDNLGALLIEPTGVDLASIDGTSFVFVNEGAYANTAHLIIDSGLAPARRIRVATNINRNLDGTLAGLTLGRALDMAGVRWEMADNPNLGYKVLSGLYIDDVGEWLRPETTDEPPPRSLGPTLPEDAERGPRGVLGAWFVVVSRDGEVVDVERDFDTIVIQNRDTVNLVYVRDRDRDGLFDRQELFFGSRDSSVDSDGDGLSDFFEIKARWTIEVNLGDDAGGVQSREVMSTPALFDSDADGWSDAEEYLLGTDPRNRDTDGDSFDDPNDNNPLDARE